MQQRTHVLIITRDNVIRNLLEQVFIIRDVRMVISATGPGAEAIATLWGLDAFSLAIIDMAALGESESDQQLAVDQLLNTWVSANSGLPVIVLATFLQKHNFHQFSTDRVRALVKPFRVDELIDAIEMLDWDNLSPSICRRSCS